MNKKTFASMSKGLPPNKLVRNSLDFVINKEKALDLGSGSLRDSKFLVKSGFNNVTAVDKELIENYNSNINFIQSNISEYSFTENNFDLVIAINSLPFLSKEDFNKVFQDIEKSLNNDGVLCFTLFGIKDEWSSREKMNFHNKENILNLIKDFKIKTFIEEESEGKTMDGKSKHWNIFRIIVTK